MSRECATDEDGYIIPCDGKFTTERLKQLSIAANIQAHFFSVDLRITTTTNVALALVLMVQVTSTYVLVILIV